MKSFKWAQTVNQPASAINVCHRIGTTSVRHPRLQAGWDLLAFPTSFKGTSKSLLRQGQVHSYSLTSIHSGFLNEVQAIGHLEEQTIAKGKTLPFQIELIVYVTRRV
jgi:hypothetical protein